MDKLVKDGIKTLKNMQLEDTKLTELCIHMETAEGQILEIDIDLDSFTGEILKEYNLFENEPNVATDIACDTWDVKEGKFLQLTNPVFLSEEDLGGQNYSELFSELGDWRDSLVEINDETL